MSTAEDIRVLSPPSTRCQVPRAKRLRCAGPWDTQDSSFLQLSLKLATCLQQNTRSFTEYTLGARHHTSSCGTKLNVVCPLRKLCSVEVKNKGRYLIAEQNMSLWELGKEWGREGKAIPRGGRPWVLTENLNIIPY